MKTTAFNSPEKRKWEGGLNSPLVVELMRSSLVRRQMKLREVKGGKKSLSRRRSLVFTTTLVAVFSTTRIFEPQRSHCSPPYF